MWQWRFWEKPKHRRNQQESWYHQTPADNDKNIITSIIGIRTVIDRVANAQQARHNQTDTHERARKKREYGTIAALVLAAAVAVWGIIQSHKDTAKALREAHITADQQARIMSGQLAEMHKTLVMSERPWLYIKGNIEFSNINPFESNITGFYASAVVIENRGKAIATNVEIVGEIIAHLPPSRAEPIYSNNVACPKPFIFLGHARLAEFAIPAQREQNVPFGGKVEPQGPPRTNRLQPYLLGCIQYKWPASDETFHTRFYLAIGIVEANAGEVWYNLPEHIKSFRQIEEINYIDAD
jgi:hypothetical protein